MFRFISRLMWPDLSDVEVRKYSILAVIFAFLIGTYWALRGTKDTLIILNVGNDYFGRAKILSLIFISLCVFVYTRLVDVLRRHQLFYVIGGFYSTSFFLLALSFLAGRWGVIPHRVTQVLSFVTYLFVESYGSLMIPLFWAFVLSMTDTNTSKKVFPMLVACGQIGGILFPLSAQWLYPRVNIAGVFLVMSCASMIAVLMVRYFMMVTPASELEPHHPLASGPKRKPGFFEGLRIIVKYPYFMGVLVISTFYEIVITISDIYMKKQARLLPAYASDVAIGQFLSIVGWTANLTTLVVALLGTRQLIKRLGVRISLFIFPAVLGGILVIRLVWANCGNPSPSVLLWLSFLIVVLGRALTYAINNPAKEMVYIPTSKDAKFKAKGWIEAFGARSAKASSGIVGDMYVYSLPLLLTIGSVIGLVGIGVWFFAAFYVGKKYDELIKEDKVLA